MKRKGPTSANTISRLPKYIRLMEELEAQGFDHISSGSIARILGMTASQVRQDLTQFGSYGAQGYGYNVEGLKSNLKRVMGLHRQHNVAIMGAGSIGKTLLCHMRFQENNYHVVAAFDTNEELIGKSLNGTPVYHPCQLDAVHAITPIDICVLSVSAEHAKMCARQIEKAEIPAIWNLTNVDLALKGNTVIVENMHFLDSLFGLTYYLEESRPGV